MPETFMLLAQDPDWTVGIDERLEFLTDVLPGYNSSEQRVQLRTYPRMRLKYDLLFASSVEAGLFLSQLWKLKAQRVLAPLWQDAAELEDDAEALDESLSLETATRRFLAGGQGLLWRSASQSEIVEIETVDVGGLTLASALVGNWPADGRTRVLPLFRGRLDASPQLVQATSTVSSLAIEVETEGLAFVEAAAPESYLEFELWPLEPDRAEDQSQTWKRSLNVLDPGYGTNAAWDRAAYPLLSRQSLKWLASDRTEAAALIAFLLRRRGQLVPFWAPSWNADLQMSANLAGGSNELHIQDVGYRSGPFLNAARRTLCLIASGTHDERAVLDAAAGIAEDEVLTLDSSLPAGLDKDRALISYLMLQRLASDNPPLHWHSDQAAELSLETFELAFENEEVTGS